MPRPNLAEYADAYNNLQRAMTQATPLLIEGLDTRTNRRIVIVATAHMVGKEIKIAPLAQLFDGNPYEYLASPDPDSDGYCAPDGKVITQMQADHAENSPADSPTLDEIARLMADEEWNADTADKIAALLRANGRDLTPTHEYTTDDDSTETR